MVQEWNSLFAGGETMPEGSLTSFIGPASQLSGHLAVIYVTNYATPRIFNSNW